MGSWGPRPTAAADECARYHPGSFAVPIHGSSGLHLTVGRDTRPHWPAAPSPKHKASGHAAVSKRLTRPSTAPSRMVQPQNTAKPQQTSQTSHNTRRTEQELFLCLRTWLKQNAKQHERAHVTLLKMLHRHTSPVHPSTSTKRAATGALQGSLEFGAAQANSVTALGFTQHMAALQDEAVITADHLATCWNEAVTACSRGGQPQGQPLGSPLSAAEALTLVSAAGLPASRHNASATVRVDAFVRKVLQGEAHETSLLQLCRGPPSHPDEARGRRILAPPAREALLPPTGFDWDAADAAAAADVPAELVLEQVHGYESVRNSAPNVHFACGGRRVVHYAACLGISTHIDNMPAVAQHGTTASTGSRAQRPDHELCGGISAESSGSGPGGIRDTLAGSEARPHQPAMPVRAERSTAHSMTHSTEHSESVAVDEAVESVVDYATCMDGVAGSGSVTVDSGADIGVVRGTAAEANGASAVKVRKPGDPAPDARGGLRGRLQEDLRLGVAAADPHGGQCMHGDDGDALRSNRWSEGRGARQPLAAALEAAAGGSMGSSVNVDSGVEDALQTLVPEVGMDSAAARGRSAQHRSDADGHSSSMQCGRGGSADGRRLSGVASGCEGTAGVLRQEAKTGTDSAAHSTAAICSAAADDAAGACNMPAAHACDGGSASVDGGRSAVLCCAVGTGGGVATGACGPATPPHACGAAKPVAAQHAAAGQWKHEAGVQSFFRGHDDDVLCVAVHPGGKLAATGQVDTIAGQAYAAVWSVETCQELTRMHVPEGSRGVYALAFSGGSGALLVAAAGDNRGTVSVFDWAAGRLVSTGPGYAGVPPQVFGVAWDVLAGGGQLRFVTFGMKHVKMWEYCGRPGQLFRDRNCAWAGAAAQDVLCAVFLPARVDHSIDHMTEPVEASRTIRREADSLGPLATGHPSGHVYIWRHRCAVRVLRPALCPPQARVRSDGNPWATLTGSGGVRCLRCWALPHGPNGAAATARSTSSDRAETGLKPGALPAPDAPRLAESGADAWFLGSASDDGAVHIWNLPADSPSTAVTTGEKTRDAERDGRAAASRQGFQASALSGMHGRHARRVMSVWVPRRPHAAARSPVRAFDVAPSPGGGGGLRVAVGTYDGTLWLCELPDFPTARSEGHRFDEPAAELWYPSATLDAFPTSPPVATHTWRRLLCSHTSTVNACATHPLKPHVYASAGAAGKVFLWHAGRRAPLGGGPITTAAGSVTALAFSPSGAHLALGLSSGHIDVRDQQRRQLCYIAACAGRVNDLKYAPEERSTAQRSTALLAVAGSDCSVTLLAVARGYRVAARCRGHSAAVAHLDFSVDATLLRSVCSACEVLYWDMPCGTRLTCCQRDQAWATWTAKVGFPVMALWRAGDDRSDINAVCRAPSRALVAAADDFGSVRLARFPCVMRDTPLQRHRAHAAHVTAVRFLCDSRRIVSGGGGDACVMQWRVAPLSSGGGGADCAGLVSGDSIARGSVPSAQHAEGEAARTGVVGLAGAEATVSAVRSVEALQRELDAELASLTRSGRKGQKQPMRAERPCGPPAPPAGATWGLIPSATGKQQYGWRHETPASRQEDDGSGG
eukprot:jgi/Ulvmu1/12689/UM094_0047.1